MKVKQRQIHLSLSLAEWETVIRELDSLPETATACGRAIDTLRGYLHRVDCGPDELVVLSQTSLAWSPVILGVCLHLSYKLTLLPMAQRLRSQMEVQVRRIESPVQLEDPAEVRHWQPLPMDDWQDRVDPN